MLGILRILTYIINEILKYAWLGMIGYGAGLGIGLGIGWVVSGAEGLRFGADIGREVGLCVGLLFAINYDKLSGIGKKSWDTGLLVLYCILAYLLPPWGLIFGGANMSKRNSEERRNQAVKILLCATIGFIINAALVFALLMFLGILGAAVQG